MKQTSASYFAMKCLYILFCALLYNLGVEGNKFHVQVLPAEYSWNVSVSCKGCHYINPQTNGSDYLTFEVSSYSNKIKQLKVTIKSADVIKGQIRSQEWTLKDVRFKTEEGNFFDFGKLHQFNFGQFKAEGQNFFLEIQSNYGAFVTAILAKVQKTNDEAKITEEEKAQIKNVKSVAKIPEEFKKYFASISGFNEEIELSREQFYGFELIRLDLMGKTSKPTLKKTLSSLSPISSSKNLFRSSSSKSMTTSSKKPSAIEKYITKYANPKLTVRIYMKVKCGYFEHDKADPYAEEVVYRIDKNSYYHCKSCKNKHVDGVKDHNVYTSLTKELFKLPSLKRTIQNPILQNGNGLKFTYIFDFAKEQDMKMNLNFVRLVELTPNNLHNESTSSHVPEYGYKTREHPTGVSTNFQNLNLRDDEDGSESETERPNYSAKHEGKGTKLNFDEGSTSSGSSGKKKSSKPPMGNHKINRGMEHPDSANAHKPRRQLTKVSSMPVPRGSEHGATTSDHLSHNAEHTHYGSEMQHGGSSHSGPMNGGMDQYSGYEYHSGAKEGYNPAMYGHHPSFYNPTVYGNFGDHKTFGRSESMPFNKQNGGDYTGRHPLNLQHNYGSDSSDYESSSYTNSLFDIGSESMNSRNQIIEEPVEHTQNESFGHYSGNNVADYSGSHDVNYSGNNGGNFGHYGNYGSNHVGNYAGSHYGNYGGSHGGNNGVAYSGNSGSNFDSNYSYTHGGNHSGNYGVNAHPSYSDHHGGGTPSIYPMPDQYGNIVDNHDDSDDSWWKSLM